MSTVVLDTITGKSTATTITIGSTPVVSASANSMTIRGEGSAQTSVQQGLAKCWNNYNQHVSSDSFNVGSMTDQSTGRYLTTFTNNMANNTFATSISGLETSYNNVKSGTNSTSTIGCQMSDTNGNDNDQNVNSTIVCGDLA